MLRIDTNIKPPKLYKPAKSQLRIDLEETMNAMPIDSRTTIIYTTGNFIMYRRVALSIKNKTFTSNKVDNTLDIYRIK